MAAIAAGFLMLNLAAVLPYGLLSGGSPLSNATSNILTSGLPAKDFTSAVVRALSIAVVLSDGAAAGARRILSRTVAVLGLSAVSLAGPHGYVALWPMVFETRTQVDLMNRITEGADLRTRLVMLRLGGMPTRVNADYAELTLQNPYFDEPISYDLWDGRDPKLPELKAKFPSEGDLKTLDDNATRDAYIAYVIFSEQSNKAVRYYGDFRPEAADIVQDALRESPNWELFYEDGDTVVFRNVNEDNAPS